ncbi:uncharacterized protein LOC132903502 [Amyelois transitella]|uniref:uncharacterized protein LOC132903502 n=1 Tax=Amyelois transitella TaxID=680683 RepID=UPI00298FC837|nr:uncharacterized protein LOC132903502 [Amyelois transitella]
MKYIFKLSAEESRSKRDVGGTLNIQTNHAQPIHADVKPEAVDVTEKVTPPKDAVYELKSLRKSLPLTDTLELIRSISRVTTLTVLLVSAIVEFFPLIQHLYYIGHLFLSS